MSGGLTASFALRHARQIQGMLEEVNSQPPARIAVGGSRRPAHTLAAALAGEEAGAVGVVAGANGLEELTSLDALVVVIDELPLEPAELDTLRRAERASVALVAVLLALGETARRDEVPYVVATDVIVAGSIGEAVLPVVERLAEKAKGEAYRIARALPHHREPVSRAIIRHYARLNGLVGAAAFIPGADLPIMTVNQLRMVARLAGAQGIELDTKRLVELAAVVGASLGLRGVARSALALLPGPTRAIKGSVALGGTTAVGEAALRRFQAEAGAVEPDC